MTTEDFYQLQRLARHMSNLPRVGVFSPIRKGEKKIFPKATALSRQRWDLNKPNRRRFDLLVASNVFMFSPDPARWFRHVLASCKYFLMLDVVRRRRSESGEFGTDGDCMRYAVGDARPRVERHFDLTSLGDRLLGYHTFHGGANTFDNEPLHVVGLFRGDLADPILRFDDYPTGVRPILSDLSPLHDILRRVEARGLSYYLGIVPGLLSEEMFRFLADLKHMIPAVHGYDHGYPNYAPVLEAKGDPFNQRTVKLFNEFKGQPYGTILTKLREGRRLLRERIGKSVEAYIPPCNVGDRRTGRALVEASYDLYLSDKRIPGCPLPWVRSDFSGRSVGYDHDRLANVIALHVTWEWDVVRLGDTGGLDRFLDHLADRKRAERERGTRLGAIVSNENVTTWGPVQTSAAQPAWNRD